MLQTATIKYINIICLLVAIGMVLALPVKKEIWYDETVSILISKGISSDAPARFSEVSSVSSATLASLNTNANVFNATVTDNANSFVYNITLHWFTGLFGNDIGTYVLFSKLCGILTLLAFFYLCTMFFDASIFTSLAVLLLAADIDFIGMSHEVRAYAMGMTFATLAGISFFKFLRYSRPVHLLLTGLMAVAAVLTHFLSVYIVLVLCLSMLIIFRQRLFTAKNIMAMAVPVILIGLFFFFAWPGLQIMSKQNMKIQERTLTIGFSVWHVVTGTMKFIALNFKAVFSAFINQQLVVLISFLGVVVLYFAAWKNAADKIVKLNLHLLFAMGVSSSLFLAFLSLKSGHYTSLYYRYHSFSIPFSTLFTVYAVSILFKSKKIHTVIKAGTLAAIVLPVMLLFGMAATKKETTKRYNHVAIANLLQQNYESEIILPKWRDAFLLNSLLPPGYKMNYVLRENEPYFTFRIDHKETSIPVLANDN